MKQYIQTIAYRELKSFLENSYEIKLENRDDIKKEIIEKYINDIQDDRNNVQSRALKKIDLYFKADNIDKKIILKKLDRIVKEINMNID